MSRPVFHLVTADCPTPKSLATTFCFTVGCSPIISQSRSQNSLMLPVLAMRHIFGDTNNTVGGCADITIGVKLAFMSTLGLEKAISEAGGQVALASLLGIRQSHISNWKNRGKRVPAEWVIKIEKATGVPRHELRPDLYPTEDVA